MQVVGLSRIEDYDGPISKDIPPGAVGIGLYDLSDITLLFDNKEHALDFAGDIAELAQTRVSSEEWRKYNEA